MWIKIKKICFVLIIILILVSGSENNIWGIGTHSGTIITNIKDYIGSIFISTNYIPSKMGELFVKWADSSGKTNLWNGKYFYNSGMLMTNNTSVTIISGYDLSSIPSSYYHTGKIGTYVNFIYYITNKGNTSDSFFLNFSIENYNDNEWNNNLLSLLINDVNVVNNTNFINYSTSLIAPDSVLKITLRELIPVTVNNSSTNLIKFTIYNSVYNTNTGTGDNWPGRGAILPSLPDTNSSRDYQISYITTRATGLFHYLTVNSANDMIHTIYNFNGNENLANTEITINITLDKKPEDINSFFLYYGINTKPEVSDKYKIKVEGDGLNYYAIIPNSILKEIKNLSSFNFIFTLDSETYYRDGISGNTFWGFNVKPVSPQRNNVNILCNLLNPNKGDKSILLYSLDKPSKVTIEIYTLSGEKVRTLFSGDETGGAIRRIYWDGRNEYGNIVGEGLYFISFRTEEFNELRKVIVVK